MVEFLLNLKGSSNGSELKDLPYEQRLRMLNPPTLLYRRQRFDLIQIFKIINGFDNIDTD